MAEHDTNCIQPTMLDFCPRFDGKDKAQFLEYKYRLRVVLSFYRQSVAAILQAKRDAHSKLRPQRLARWCLRI